MCSWEMIPAECAMNRNENLLVALTETGGHVGFLEGIRFWGPGWLDRVAVEFIHAVHSLRHSKKHDVAASKPEVVSS